MRDRRLFMRLLKSVINLKVLATGKVLFREYDRDIYERSIKYVRDPTEHERTEFRRIRALRKLDPDPDDEAEDPSDPENEEAPECAEKTREYDVTWEMSPPTHTPSWTACKPLHDQMYDSIASGGRRGATSVV